MKIAPFATEHFYARYEFNTPYQLCNSDCETVSIETLLSMAEVPLEALTALTLGYTESQGNPALRERIATKLYTAARPEDVVVLGTPIEGIYLAARALLQPEDEVIVLTPAYDALVNVFEHIVGAAHIKKWAFVLGAQGWQLDMAHLQQLISARTKMLVVNFPHNPTGYLPTPTELNELVALCEAHGIWLFCDEMYYGLVHSGTERVPSVADLTPRALVLSGLSKTYGLPGLRTGWLVVRDEALRQEIINWKFYTSICPPAPSEFLALAALKVSDALREKNIGIIEQNLSLAGAFFARWQGLFEWHPPRAGSTALVGVNVPSITALSEQTAQEAGVLLHPATTLGGDDQHMRVGLGRQAFGEALAKFEAYLLTRADLR